MKRSTRGYILNPNNLRKAILKSYSHKTRQQREKKEVCDVMYNLQAFIDQTIAELASETYRVGEYRHFAIQDRKTRNISVLPYKDRCVQNLVKDAIEPILMNKMTDDMYGGLPGRGIVTKPCNRSVTRAMREILTSGEFSHYWLGDISKFYESLKNPVIMKRVERCVTDKFTLALIRQFVWAQPSLAIGDPFSHLLANLCMSDLVRHIKEEHPRCRIVNFADNIIIFAHSLEEANTAGRTARSFAATQLRLHFHEGDHSSPISPFEGIHFCGRVYFPSGKIRLRKGTKQNIAKAKDKPLSVASYQGILRSANCKHLTKIIYGKATNTICRQTDQSGRTAGHQAHDCSKGTQTVETERQRE